MFNESDAVYICGKCTQKAGYRRTHNRYTTRGKEHLGFAVFRKPDKIQNNPVEEQKGATE